MIQHISAQNILVIASSYYSLMRLIIFHWGYRHIAELSATPHRLGLTATYEREDSLHSLLPLLVGGKVYGKSLKNFQGLI